MKLPKIGVIGWIGVVMFLLGSLTFLTARKNADDLQTTTYENPSDGETGFEQLSVDDKMAKDAGYDSYGDYLTAQNRRSGTIFIVSGIVLVIWNKKRLNKKSPPPLPASPS